MSNYKSMTVGELRALLSTFPDELPIVTWRSNMEGCGYEATRIIPRVKKVVKIKETRIDAFDHITYTAEVLSEDINAYDEKPFDVLILD